MEHPSKDEKDCRIPVAIITGYLGSGKTTVVNQLVRHNAYSNCLIVVNEFGEIGVDHFLISAPAENIVLLDNGCLCCSTQGDLLSTFAAIARRRLEGQLPAFGQVVLETSGLVDPVPIIYTLVADETISRLFFVDLVITVVDAVNAEVQLKQNRESVKQVAVADVILISKTDLATTSDVAALAGALKRVNPAAPIINIVQGAIDPSTLHKYRRTEMFSNVAFVHTWLGPSVSDHRNRLNRHLRWGSDDDIRSFSLMYEQPIARSGLVLWLNLLSRLYGRELLRVKGLLNVDGAPVAVHMVQAVVHEPLPLAKWPDTERRSRLVFIGCGIVKSDIERTFAAFSFGSTKGSGDHFPDPKIYTQFVEIAKSFVRGCPHNP